MKAVDFINENLNPIAILEHYHFREITELGDTIRACCEIHKGNNPTAFIWNKSNNLWFCYTGDCHGGDVFTLIEKMEGVDFMQAVPKAASILGLDITGMKIQKQTDLVLKNTTKWLQTMGQINKHRNVHPYVISNTKLTLDCLTFNRFGKETLTFYDAAFCKIYPTEETLLYNKLMIPIFFEDVIRGVALRDTTGKYYPKWFYQPDGLEIRELLYNYDVAMETVKTHSLSQIILVEGIFDVWAYHEIGIDNVVAVFGSTLKKEQGNILLKTGLDWILSFDNDEAGIKCTHKVIDGYKKKVELELVHLPTGSDPGDLTKDELTDCYVNRTKI